MTGKAPVTHVAIAAVSAGSLRKSRKGSPMKRRMVLVPATRALVALASGLVLAACGGAGSGGDGGNPGGGGGGGGTNVITLASGQGNPMGLAVNGTDAYWVDFVDSGALMKVPLGGGTPTQVAALANPSAVALDATH